MTERQNRQWILKERPKEGPLDASKVFEKRTQTMPALKEGQVVAQVLYLSFDPTQRGWIARDTYMPAVPLGEPVRAIGVAQVVESKHASFQPGDIVNGMTGWQEYLLWEPDDKDALVSPEKLPGHLDPLRMLTFIPTAVTAYFGMLDIGKLKAGDTVLVSGAAGATGSVAGQIAKIKGASKVVGIAGGPEKCKWLTEKAGFDAAIDYKNDNVGEKLKELFPDGVDVFYDNVGGQILDHALMNLALKARIVMCGGISQYNLPESELYGVKGTMMLTMQRATMQGFVIVDFKDRYLEGLLTLNEWTDSGKLLLEVDEQEGFDNIPATLERLFSGANTGKQVLKLSEPSLAIPSNAVEKLVVKVMSLYFSLWKNG